MPTILAERVVMVELVFTQYSQRMENVFHVQCAGVPTPANLTAIRDIFIGWDTPNPVGPPSLRGIRAANTLLTLIKLTSIHSVGAPVLEYVLPVPSAGAVGVNIAPHLTIAVKWGTGLSGRSFRGRTYHCGLTVGPGNDGLVSAGQVTAYQAVYQRLLTDLGTAGYPLVVVSKYSGVQIVNGYRRGIPRPVGVVTPITTCGVERGLDTMRKRKIPHQV